MAEILPALFKGHFRHYKIEDKKTFKSQKALRISRRFRHLYVELKKIGSHVVRYVLIKKQLFFVGFIIIILTTLLAVYPIKNIIFIPQQTTLINSTDIQDYKRTLKHKPFFLLSSNKLALILKNSDNRIANVYITKKWPGTIIVKLVEKHYIAKTSINNHFYLISSDNNIFLVSKNIYNKENLPVIYNLNLNDLKILLPKISLCINLINQATSQNKILLIPKRVTAIMDRWHIPTIKIIATLQQTRSQKGRALTILFNPQKSLEQQVNYLVLFILEAKQQKLSYNYIDLRFDRIIIK